MIIALPSTTAKIKTNSNVLLTINSENLSSLMPMRSFGLHLNALNLTLNLDGSCTFGKNEDRSCI